ncbi:uncharacterized protein [Miscanthus floridulus]|uniref:uncharacterized protein isoform X3 n=1 Tax=Miscanthus floridulus TaxID=154761 RepID=UPI0034584713
MVRYPVHAGPPHDQHTFNEYLWWLHRSTRTHIKPPYTDVAIDEDSEKDVIEDVYDVTTRENTQLERAPLQRYMATQLSRLSNEAAFRLHESRGQGPGVLVAFVEKVKKSCRKLAQKLSCIDTPYEEPPLPRAVGWHVFSLFEDTSRLFSADDFGAVGCHFRGAYTTTS